MKYLNDLNDSKNVILESKLILENIQKENEISLKTFNENDRTQKLLISSLQSQLNEKKNEIEEQNNKEKEYKKQILLNETQIIEVITFLSLFSLFKQ